jgi:hypothetical protein
MDQTVRLHTSTFTANLVAAVAAQPYIPLLPSLLRFLCAWISNTDNDQTCHKRLLPSFCLSVYLSFRSHGITHHPLACFSIILGSYDRIVKNSFSMKPTEALVSKYILVQNSTCFGYFLYTSTGASYCTFGTCTCYAGLTTASVVKPA